MNESEFGKPPKDWERVFAAASLRTEELGGCKSSHAKAIKIGQFLSPNVGRAVTIEANGRTGRAVLRVAAGRVKEKRYFFEVAWDAPVACEPSAAPPAGRPEGDARATIGRPAPATTAGEPRTQAAPIGAAREREADARAVSRLTLDTSNESAAEPPEETAPESRPRLGAGNDEAW